jgi:hypothetical protein
MGYEVMYLLKTKDWMELACGWSPVVEHLPHNPWAQGFNSAAVGILRDKIMLNGITLYNEA